MKKRRYTLMDSPGVIESCTRRGHYLMGGFASFSVWFFAINTLASRVGIGFATRTRSALYSFFHARSRAAARANDKLCTRICIFDTWLQRPGRNVPALSYVTGPAAFGSVVSPVPSPVIFCASFCNCGVPLFVHDINFAFYNIALYYIKFVYYSKIFFVKRKNLFRRRISFESTVEVKF